MGKFCFSIVALFMIFLSEPTSAAERYICEEKLINQAGYKSRYILELESTKYKVIAVKDGKGVEVDVENKYSLRKDRYFVGIEPYQKGYVISIFDGVSYSTNYVESGYSAYTSYSCSKF